MASGARLRQFADKLRAVAFDAELFRALARGRISELGAPLVVMDETTSTNDDALAAARGGALHGATFVAELQTAGRGRRGARWLSAAGKNLTFSVVLRLELPPDRVGSLPLVVGLAVRAAAAQHVALPLGLKWPNDVLAADKKLAGVLVESQIVERRVEALVAGIGINVAERDLPAEIAEIATSIALLGGEVAREALLVEILVELEQRLKTFRADGISALSGELRAHDALRGRRVTIDARVGIARGIGDDGALAIEDERGVRRVVSGVVELLR